MAVDTRAADRAAELARQQAMADAMDGFRTQNLADAQAAADTFASRAAADTAAELARQQAIADAMAAAAAPDAEPGDTPPKGARRGR